MDLYTETPDSIVQSFKNIVSFCKQQNIVPVINCIVKINSKASPYFKEANLKIDTSNKILIAFAKAQNIDYIDLNQFVVKDNLLSDEYTTDGSHFNAKAYNIWANEISPILVKYNVK